MTAQSVPAAAKRGRSRERGSDSAGPGAGDELREGRRRTSRWRGITGFTLFALGLGLLTEEPTLLLLSVVGVGAAAYAGLGRAPEPDLTLERTFDAVDPAPGDEVAVTVTVANDGDRLLSDLRLIDGVPDGLAVVEGSPRLATALRPGERATIAYTLRARPGTHRFDPLTAVARDVPGATEYVATVEARDAVTCAPDFPEDPIAFPLRSLTTRFTGRTTSEEGGTGVEFHATREYRPGDPLNQIDWRRTARTNDLTTVEYRQERAAAIVLAIDARAVAAVAPDSRAESALERSVAAARDVAAALLAAGNTVGVTAISPRSCWLSPGRGVEHRVALRRLLAEDEAFQRVPDDGDVNVFGAVRSIRERLGSDTQVVLCSPLTDEDAAAAALRFDAHGHSTTVVSPDPTTDETIGQQLAGIGRTERVGSIRRAGVPVIDWYRDEPLERALARTEQRWSG